MHYHLILTERCNSRCKYCYEKSFKEFNNELDKKFKFDFSAPESSNINIEELKSFLKKDKNAVLIFYGGEPLLEIEKIKEIIDHINVPFRMQTNGKLLDNLPINYLEKIEKILVSIDGDKERTDFNKGQGTYDLIIKNIKKARKKGYKGEIVARMTLSPEARASDIYEQVMHLLSLNLFDSIHWQIDAGFYKFDYNKENFKGFVEKYNKSITRLVNWWINEIKTKNKLYRLYPFIAIADSIKKGEKTKLRCGAGHSGYAITTNGTIVACPIMNCIKDFEAGNLQTNPAELKKFEIRECNFCNYKDLCGGRCLYWRKAKLWPKEGDDLICKTIKHLIEELKKAVKDNPKIKNQDFSYEKYFGPEIIP